MGRVFFTAIIIMGLSSVSFGYSGGSGTAGDPYQIGTAADLLELAATTGDYGAYFVLTANIDLSSSGTFATAVIAPDMDNSNWEFDGPAFTGIFNGNGHKISNLTINSAGNDYLGLFGGIDGGEIKNLGLKNVSITGGNESYYLGGLVGINHSGSISNCFSTGAVIGGDISHTLGGLVGYNYSGNINNCYLTGTVTGGDYSYWLGGLVLRLLLWSQAMLW